MDNIRQFENAPFGLITFDSNLRIGSLNKAAMELDHRLTENSFLDQLYSEFKNESFRDWLRSSKSDFSLNLELIDGRRASINIWMHQEPGSGPIYFASIASEQQQTKLQIRRELLAEAAEQAWESICITDADLAPPGPRYVYANKAFEALTGYSEAEVIGKSPRVQQGPLTDRTVLNHLKEELGAGRIFHGETINYRKNGETFWIEWKICPVLNEIGKVSHFVAFQRDVTELKTAQTRAKEYHSVLSHELRAPLTSMLGALRLIEAYDKPRSKDGKEMLEIALTCTERMAKLVDDLLDLNKIESGQLKFKMTRCFVPDLLKIAKKSLGTYHAEHKVGIKLEPSPLYVNADKDRIVQVLVNLISNAMKFSPPGSDVVVKVEPTDQGVVRFSVIDEGPGISSENQLKLFSKFLQLIPADGHNRTGTGLGLAISKSIVEQHSGKIGVESTVGRGTKFWFDIAESVTEENHTHLTKPRKKQHSGKFN